MISLFDIPENRGLNPQLSDELVGIWPPALVVERAGAGTDVVSSGACRRCSDNDAYHPAPQLGGNLLVDPEIRLENLEGFAS